MAALLQSHKRWTGRVAVFLEAGEEQIGEKEDRELPGCRTLWHPLLFPEMVCTLPNSNPVRYTAFAKQGTLMTVITLLIHSFKWGEDRSIGGAFYLVLNSQNKNPYKDIQVFIKTQAESYLAIASLIMIYEACFGILYQLFRKKNISAILPS